MTSMFNPDAFLNAAFTEANSTKALPVPVGEYMGIIEKVSARQWQSKDGTTSGVALDLQWLVEDETVKQFLGRPTVTVKQGIMLDFTPQGTLDFSQGKNVGLGRLREALNMNEPGKPFSFSMLPGSAAKITVNHRVNGEDTYAEVKAVARI